MISELDPNVIQLWYHYEEVAVHFNELILQYRLHLMTGTGAIGTIASIVISTKKFDDHFINLRAFIAFIIFVLFSAAAALDIFYYNKLLLGAVDALLELENKYPVINLSTSISNQFECNETLVVYYIYGGIWVLIFAFTLWSIAQVIKNRVRNGNNK